MKPEHENIFWNQGFQPITEFSENRKDKTKGRKIRQFENDVTKGLMLAIKHGKGVFKALKDLLDKQEMAHMLKNEEILDNGYYFQVIPKEFWRTRKDKKPVIPIVLKSKLTPDKPEKEEERSDSRADLILESKNRYLLIESKTLSGYAEEQIERYLCDFFPNLNRRGGERIYEIYWEDLYKKIDDCDENTKEGFITKQFKEYLELAGLSGFQGFRFGKRKNEKAHAYSYEEAKRILQLLRTELKSRDTIGKLNLVFAERPQYKHVWDPVYHKSFLHGKKKSSPDLKYSLYIWERWIGVELTISGKYRKYLREKREDFLNILEKIREKFSRAKKMGKLFFKASKYQQLNYKKGSITNPTWHSVNIELDISHKDGKPAPFDKLSNYRDFIKYLLENFSDNDFKQFGIEIRLYYDDQELETWKREIIKTIECSFKELYPLHEILKKSV